jgi:hypothetical protein
VKERRAQAISHPTPVRLKPHGKLECDTASRNGQSVLLVQHKAIRRDLPTGRRAIRPDLSWASLRFINIGEE